jgi:hypothetical protein
MSGFVFSNSMDLDQDAAKCLDPDQDTVIPDQNNWL